MRKLTDDEVGAFVFCLIFLITLVCGVISLFNLFHGELGVLSFVKEKWSFFYRHAPKSTLAVVVAGTCIWMFILDKLFEDAFDNPIIRFFFYLPVFIFLLLQVNEELKKLPHKKTNWEYLEENIQEIRLKLDNLAERRGDKLPAQRNLTQADFLKAHFLPLISRETPLILKQNSEGSRK